MTMTEEEYDLFSEFLEVQKDFARRDYEGLNQAEKELLKKKRADYAKSLRTNYRGTMKDIDRVADTPGLTSMDTKGEFSGGGVRSRYKVTSGSNSSNFKDFHKNSVRKYMLEASGNAKNIMREQVLGSSEISHEKQPNPTKKPNLTEKLKPIKSTTNKLSQKIPKSGTKKAIINWAKKNKKPLGIATAVAGTAALAGGGAYAYNKS